MTSLNQYDQYDSATLEPTGLFSADGKRPDGLTLTAWDGGKYVLGSYSGLPIGLISSSPQHNVGGSSSFIREQLKINKYRNIGQSYSFRAAGFETMGPWGPETIRLVKEIGKRSREQTGEQTQEPRSRLFETTC